MNLQEVWYQELLSKNRKYEFMMPKKAKLSIRVLSTCMKRDLEAADKY